MGSSGGFSFLPERKFAPLGNTVTRALLLLRHQGPYPYKRGAKEATNESHKDLFVFVDWIALTPCLSWQHVPHDSSVLICSDTGPPNLLCETLASEGRMAEDIFHILCLYKPDAVVVSSFLVNLPVDK